MRNRNKLNISRYTICKRDGRYYLAFTDGQGAWHELEITADLYGALDQFELDDLAALNEWDRHIEHLEQTEQAINRRAVNYPKSVEDTVLRNLEYEQLHKAIAELPETQRRRLTLYYFQGLTYGQIAKIEKCSHPAIMKSVSAAIDKIKKKLSE